MAGRPRVAFGWYGSITAANFFHCTAAPISATNCSRRVGSRNLSKSFVARSVASRTFNLVGLSRCGEWICHSFAPGRFCIVPLADVSRSVLKPTWT